MILAIDIGNTNITLGGYQSGELQFVSRLATDSNIPADQYAVQIKGIVELYDKSKEDIEDAIICSVVPTVGNAVFRAIKKLTGNVPLMLGPGIKTGLNIKIDNPAQLGADLAAGAVGALGVYPLPCVVIDMGTATTISVLDKDGALVGGAIAAGIRSTLDALSSKTAQLPDIHPEAPASVIGKNTIDSMKSGLIIGAAAMLDGMIDRIEDEIGSVASVVATGGLAETVVVNCRREITLNENLLLDGLYKIYQKNK